MRLKRLLLLAPLLGLYLALGLGVPLADILAHRENTDFHDIYYPTRVAFDEHGSIYDYDAVLRMANRETGVTELNVHYYPPTFHVFFAPFGLLPYRPARILWLLFNHYCLFQLVWILYRFVAERAKLDGPARERLALGSAAFALIAASVYLPTVDHIWQGQSNFPVLLCAVAGAAALWKRPVRSGVFFGIAALLKIFPIAFGAYVLILRQTRTAVALACTLVGGFLLSLVMFPDSSYVQFVRSLQTSSYAGTSDFNPYSYSMASMLVVLFDPGVVPNAVSNVLRYGPFFVGLWLFYWGRKSAPRERHHELVSMLRLSEVFLFVGFAIGSWWEHHLVYELWPFYLLLGLGLGGLPCSRLALGLGIAAFVISASPLFACPVWPFSEVALVRLITPEGSQYPVFAGLGRAFGAGKFWGAALLLAAVELSVFRLKRAAPAA